MITCFGGSNESNPDVSIWLTTWESQKWSPALMVANGIISDTVRFATWNPVLFQSNSGKLFLFYKTGLNPREWRGMVIRSADGGKTWHKPEKLASDILGPIKNKPIQLTGGTIISPSSTETDKAWKVQMEISNDDGETWKRIPVDASGNFKVIQPTVLRYSNNRLQILCRSDQQKLIESWSLDEGKTWSKLTPIDLPNPNSGIDAVTLNDGTQMLVYNPTIPGKEWYEGRAKLAVATSVDGEIWKQILLLENESKKEFSYPAIIQTADGKVHITYTFDRKNIKHVVLQQR